MTCSCFDCWPEDERRSSCEVVVARNEEAAAEEFLRKYDWDAGEGVTDKMRVCVAREGDYAVTTWTVRGELSVDYQASAEEAIMGLRPAPGDVPVRAWPEDGGREER